MEKKRQFTWEELSLLNKEDNAHVAVRGKVRLEFRIYAPVLIGSDHDPCCWPYLFFVFRCTMLVNSSTVIQVVKICCWWVQGETWRLCSRRTTLLVIQYKSKLSFKSKDLNSSKSKFCILTSLTVISLPVRMWSIFTNSLIIVMQLFICLRAKTWDSKRPSEPKNTIIASNKERLKRGLHNDIVWVTCMNKILQFSGYFCRNVRLILKSIL